MRSPAVQAEKAQEELPTPDGKVAARWRDDGDLLHDYEDVVVSEPRVQIERVEAEILEETSPHDVIRPASLHSSTTGSPCRTEARKSRNDRAQPAPDDDAEWEQLEVDGEDFGAQLGPHEEVLHPLPTTHSEAKSCARATKRAGVEEPARRSSRADVASRGASRPIANTRGVGAIAIASRTNSRAPPMQRRPAIFQSGGRPGTAPSGREQLSCHMDRAVKLTRAQLDRVVKPVQSGRSGKPSTGARKLAQIEGKQQARATSAQAKRAGAGAPGSSSSRTARVNPASRPARA